VSNMVRKRGRSVRNRALALLAATTGLFLTAPWTAEAQNAQVELLGNMIAGLYPGSGSNAQTAVFMIHETDDFISNTACSQLNSLGFTALCAKSQYTSDGEVMWDQLALDVAQGVSFLRKVPGVTHVVLVGWSGGGAISAYYQNVAENGVAACQGTTSLDPCTDVSLAGLPPADGVVLLDSIPGLAFADLTAWDPSVQPDGLSSSHNPALYLFNPANGWNSNQLQSSTYSSDFINRYTQAQADREALLVGVAQQLQKQIADGNAAFTNDLPFTVGGHDKANIFSTDSNLLSHTQGQYPLITPSTCPNPYPASCNGTVQTVYTVRNPAAGASLASTPAANDAWSPNFAFSVQSFMSIVSIRAPNFRLTADNITGVDWSSSNTATVANMAGVHAPVLIMSMTAHYWMVPSELYYLAATKSSSRTLAYVYGATHEFTPCTVCTSMPQGPYGNTVAELFNYVAHWLNAKFP
jgi:hypothetical protein